MVEKISKNMSLAYTIYAIIFIVTALSFTTCQAVSLIEIIK